MYIDVYHILFHVYLIVFLLHFFFFFFFFNDTATTEIYTLSLHDALPISPGLLRRRATRARPVGGLPHSHRLRRGWARSEEHTSELQSRSDLVCRLLLEKKKHNTHSILVYHIFNI